MDTNLLQVLITSLANQKTPSVTGGDGLSNLLIAGLFLLAAVAPTFVSLAAFLQAKAGKAEALEAKVASLQNTATIGKVEEAAKVTSVLMEKVHTAVNGKDTATTALIAELRKDIVNLVAEKATLTEHQRGQEVAATPNGAAASTPGVTDAQISLMVQALSGHLVAKEAKTDAQNPA